MYCKLFSSLYQGTLRGKAYPILVFTNLLAHADKDGFVDKHFKAIAEEVGISIEEVKAAIAELEAPDTESRSQEFEGRRLLRIDEHRNWGWRIVNYLKYRSIRNEEDRREQNRNAQAAYRNRSKQSKPASAEVSQGKLQSAHTDVEAEEEADTSTPSSPPKGGRKYKKETDDEFIQSLQAKECYQGIDVRLQLQKMTTWCEANGQQPSRRRFVNWLNRCDKPLRSTPVNKRNVGVAGGDQAVQMGLIAQQKVNRIQEEEMRKMKELEARGEL